MHARTHADRDKQTHTRHTNSLVHPPRNTPDSHGTTYSKAVPTLDAHRCPLSSEPLKCCAGQLGLAIQDRGAGGHQRHLSTRANEGGFETQLEQSRRSEAKYWHGRCGSPTEDAGGQRLRQLFVGGCRSLRATRAGQRGGDPRDLGQGCAFIEVFGTGHLSQALGIGGLSQGSGSWAGGWVRHAQLR